MSDTIRKQDIVREDIEALAKYHNMNIIFSANWRDSFEEVEGVSGAVVSGKLHVALYLVESIMQLIGNLRDDVERQIKEAREQE